MTDVAANRPLTPGLRDRKKAEARAALVDAALELFSERGFDSVSVEAIADRAGVSRRSFFRYFPTKEAVVLERRHAQLAALEAALTGAPARATVRELIRGGLEGLAAEYDRDKRRVLRERELFARSQALTLADLELDRAFERAIAKAVTTRLGNGERAGRSARVFAAALMAVLRVAIEDWADAKGRVSLRELGDEAVEAALRVLSG